MNRVVARSDILSVDSCDWETSRGLCNLWVQEVIPTFYGAAGFQDLDGMFNISKKKEILVQHQIIIIPGPAASTESAPEWYWGWGQLGRRSRLGRGSRRGWRCRRTGNWGTGQRSPLAEIVNLIMDWTSLSKLPKVSLPSSSPAGSWGRAAVRESTAARTRDCIWGKVIKMEQRRRATQSQ